MVDWRLKKKIYEVFQSQANFAAAVGINEPYVSQVVRGRRRLSLSEQKAWAKVLRCKPEDIFEAEADDPLPAEKR